jgi:chromosome partitioning protein
LEKRYQVVVVDAGGRDSKELRTAAAVTSLLLTPIKTSQADLETLPKVNELVGLARSFNPDLKAFAVLCMAPSNPAIREVAEAQELLGEFDNIRLDATVIRDRKIYRDALLAGRGEIEMNNGKAKAEIRALAMEFFE